MLNIDTKIWMCKTATGISSVIGNVAFIIKQFLLRSFPKDFFRTVYIDTQMSQIDMQKMEVIKKKVPILIIRPIISFDDNTMFEKLPDWVCTNYFVYKDLRGNYLPVFLDEDNKIFIYSSPDRIRIDFGIEIILPTRMQQINVGYWLKEAFLNKAPFHIYDCILETEIPKVYVKVIGEHIGFDFKTDDNKEALADYLSSHSQSLIIEKIKTSSGNPTWFYSYRTNLLCKTEDYPQGDDGRETNQIKDFFKISTTLNTEFWVPVNYFLEIETRKYEKPPVYDNLWEIEESDMVMMNFSHTYIIPQEKDGKNLLISKPYLVDVENEEVDELEFKRLLTSQIITAHNYMQKYNRNINDYMEIVIYKENLPLDESQFEIDWINFIAKNKNPEVNTYVIAIYINHKIINDITYRLDLMHQAVYNYNSPTTA